MITLKAISKFITLVVSSVFVFPPLISGQGTNFVNQDSKLENFYEPQWFKDNIPFIEVPDREIEEVYYYRWSSLKRHLRYTVPGAGYIVTEFVHKVGYSQKFDTINAAAGHHIYEARWLRNTRYVQDYINFWSREGGAAQQYSEWIADAAFKAFLVNGDVDFIKSQQPGLVNNFNGWNDRFEPELGMYFISPHDDAMEHSASSEQTDDPYHGGLGYRPSFNSEMYANALAIAEIAKLNGDSTTEQEFRQRASDLRSSILTHLWDNDRKFFYHMFREDNPNNELLDTREEIGFFPWRFGVPDENDRKYEEAWQELFENQGFGTSYGPTTCEVRSPWYDGNQTAQCCWWNGNSWPYSTGHTLNSIASQIKNYGITAFATVQSFVGLLHKYAETQYKNGKPYVAECHSPNRKLWVCDAFNGSDHYAHSTYTDNVLGDLLGIDPQSEDIFRINPLILPNWNYFIVENLPYHGHNITVLYDRDGSRYQVGNGMQIFVNGESAARQDEVGPMQVSIPSPIKYPNYDGANKVENYASNVNGFGFPSADASFTSIDASVWQAVDGRIIYDHIPSNRWTNFDSPNPTDWFSIDFGPGRQRTISLIKLYIYSDLEEGHDVGCFQSIVVEVQNGENWVPVENQVLNPPTCVPHIINIVEFTPVRTQKVRIVFTRDESNNHFVGFTELEILAPWPQTNDGSYEAEDGFLRDANIRETESASGESYVGQIESEGAFVEFTGIWIETPGEYDIHVYYANGGDSDSAMNVLVNNINTFNYTFPTTGNWGQFSEDNFITIRVPLLRGNNALIFQHGLNVVELDKITVVFT